METSPNTNRTNVCQQEEIDLDIGITFGVRNSEVLKIQHLLNSVNDSDRLRHKPYKTLASQDSKKSAGMVD